MRGSLASSFALVLSLSACHSSVGICGEIQVCGSDGFTYADRCAAGSAGVDVMYEGACPEECAPVRCAPGAETVEDERGCTTCVYPPDSGRGDADLPDAALDATLDARPDSDSDVGTDIGTDVVDSGGTCETSGARVSCDECGFECGPGYDETCMVTSPGTHVCLCPAGKVECMGSCVELDNDVSNCGTCGTECEDERPFCITGNCVGPPPRCTDVDESVTFSDTAGCMATCGETTWRLGGASARCTRTELGGVVLPDGICPAISIPTSEEECLRALLACCVS